MGLKPFQVLAMPSSATMVRRPDTAPLSLPVSAYNTRNVGWAPDFCKLTGIPLVGPSRELANDDEQGTMVQRDDYRAFADRWGVNMVSVEILVEWRRKVETKEATRSLEPSKV